MKVRKEAKITMELIGEAPSISDYTRRLDLFFQTYPNLTPYGVQAENIRVQLCGVPETLCEFEPPVDITHDYQKLETQSGGKLRLGQSDVTDFVENECSSPEEIFVLEKALVQRLMVMGGDCAFLLGLMYSERLRQRGITWKTKK